MEIQSAEDLYDESSLEKIFKDNEKMMERAGLVEKR